MKDKLTIEDLAPYVPYGLKLYYAPKDEIINLRPSHFTNDWSVTLASKPILRNLSDLTKEIEHNGERFVPADMILDDVIIINSGDIRMCRHGDVEKLYKWHFDVNRLIERGLAIEQKK